MSFAINSTTLQICKFLMTSSCYSILCEFQVLQFIRNGKHTSIPEDKHLLKQLLVFINTTETFFSKKANQGQHGIRVCVEKKESSMRFKFQCEAEFFGLDVYRRMLRRRLWKMTGKPTYYACYSDSD
ncbi:hypothetical protein DICVIV_05211 [Dictyocaulus viviparus]|uniref:Uncharacterized protein n=1 Tax=Dictyocaulus viviparus TaxID=29172 RepID=A0A0D8XXU3_DICVI|nr:hypothetical protein DICVIV_05211 [Dictyocaulus viviparus]